MLVLDFDARQRRAQLVRGVGGEAALLLEGGLQPGDHGVEGRRQLGQLVTPLTFRRRDRSRRRSVLPPG